MRSPEGGGTQPTRDPRGRHPVRSDTRRSDTAAGHRQLLHRRRRAAPRPRSATLVAAGRDHSRRPPDGITILAVLAGIGGVFGLLGGFGVLFVGGVVSAAPVVVLGLVCAGLRGAAHRVRLGRVDPAAVGVAARRGRRDLRHRRRGPADLIGGHAIVSQALGVVVDGGDPVLPQPAGHQVALRARLGVPTLSPADTP